MCGTWMAPAPSSCCSSTTHRLDSSALSQTVPVSIVGENTHFAQSTTTVSFGADLTVTGVTVIDATHLTLQLTVPATATLGAHTITVATGTEVVVLANSFVVGTGTPMLLSV